MNRILWSLFALVLVVPASAGTAIAASSPAATLAPVSAQLAADLVSEAGATPTTDVPPDTTDTRRPAPVDNEFIPEERNLSDCIGVLERPGCGSESRGGWRQTLVLVAIFGGLFVVFGNIARGVRNNRRAGN